MRSGWKRPETSAATDIVANLVPGLGDEQHGSPDLKGNAGASSDRRRTRLKPNQLRARCVHLHRLFPGLRKYQFDNLIVVASPSSRDAPGTRTMAISVNDTSLGKTVGMLLYSLPLLHLRRRWMWTVPRPYAAYPFAMVPDDDLFVGFVYTSNELAVAKAIFFLWHPVLGDEHEIVIPLPERMHAPLMTVCQDRRQAWVFGRDESNMQLTRFVYSLAPKSTHELPLSRVDYSNGRPINDVGVDDDVLSALTTVHGDGSMVVWRMETGEMLTMLSVGDEVGQYPTDSVWLEATLGSVDDIITFAAHLAPNILGIWTLDLAPGAVYPAKSFCQMVVANEVSGKEDSAKTHIGYHKGIFLLANDAGEVSVYDGALVNEGKRDLGAKACELAVIDLGMRPKCHVQWDDVFVVANGRRLMALSLHSPIRTM